MKDLVISAISNYLPDKIKIYVESLDSVGFDGDKIMICYNLPSETVEYLKSFGWECYGVELTGWPHMKRLIDIWWILENDTRQWRYVITTDVRDIVWQTNPSNWLEFKLRKDILVASESILNQDEPWAYKNLLEGYGPVFWDYIKPHTIGNVGVLAGKFESMKNLLMVNWLVSQAGNTQHYTDQSSLNLLINNSLIKDKIQLDSDFAFQVGSVPNPKRFEKKDITILNDLVMNGDVPYVLVHQYDRVESLNNLINKKYQ